MDLKRMIVYIAIACVVILLWNAWIKDSMSHQQQLATQQAQMTSISSSSASPITTQAANMTNTQSGASVQASTPTLGKQLTVTTDVYQAVINTNGGVIESIKLLKYPQNLGEKNNPVVLLNDKEGAQYLAESGLMSNGQAVPMVFKAAQQHYQLVPNQQSVSVKLTWENSQGLVFIKTLTFARKQYVINTHYTIINKGKQVWAGELYNELSRQDPSTSAGFLRYTTFTGVAISSPEAHYQKYKFSNLADSPIDQMIKGGWAAMIQHYFISAIIPPQDKTTHYYSQVSDDGMYSVGMLSPSILLQPGQTYQSDYKVYSGPAEYTRLSAVAPSLNLTVDFGWLWFISIIIFWLMLKIHLVVGNWGWSIVIVTLIIKAIFYKLSASSYRSMGRMRALQPKMQELKERFGDDRGKLGQATMELYKKEKVNPFGGCLPIVVQIPVFLALYYVLIESVELRQAPFILWIHDLSIPDPFYVLPILMGLSMFLQQRLSPAPPDPMQAKMMMFLPVVLTLLFLHFPAGLVLYWVVNTLASISQQWYILKTMNNKPKVLKHKKA